MTKRRIKNKVSLIYDKEVYRAFDVGEITKEIRSFYQQMKKCELDNDKDDEDGEKLCNIELRLYEKLSQLLNNVNGDLSQSSANEIMDFQYRLFTKIGLFLPHGIISSLTRNPPKDIPAFNPIVLWNALWRKEQMKIIQINLLSKSLFNVR